MTTTNGSLQDGISRHILTLAPALNRLPDVECAVCITFPEGELSDALRREGVRVYALGAPHGHHWRAFVGFYRAVRDFRPDLFHGSVIPFAAHVVGKFLFPGTPWVSTYHGARCVVKSKSIWAVICGWLGRIVEVRFRKVFYVSRDSMRIDERLGLYSTDVRRLCYNPLDFSRPIPAAGKLRALLGLPEDVPLVGTACRIAAIKRPDLFTRTMCGALGQVSRAQAVIIGEGPSLDAVRRIVAESGMQERIHLLGYRIDASELVADLDCFVMTSEREGMPTALLEAIAVRTPVAFMKVPGGLTDIAEMSEREGPFAVTVPYEDTESLTAGIVRLLGDGDLRRRFADRAFEVCRRTLSVDEAVRRCHAGYLEALEGHALEA